MTEERAMPIPEGEVSPPIKPLWLDHRRAYFRSEFDNGPAEMAMPRLLLPQEIDDFEAWIAIIVSQFRRRAQAIAFKEQPND